MQAATNNVTMLLLQQKHAIQQARQTLVQGQLLFGQVEKLINDQNALVRFSNFLAYAKVEVPLQVGEKSWFQVVQNTQPIVLKYLPTLQREQQGVANLLQTVGLTAPSQQEVEFVSSLFQRQLPIQKTQLQSLVQTMQALPLSEAVKGSIDFVLARQWEPSVNIVRGVQEVLFGSAIHTKLLSLQQDALFQQHYQQSFSQPFTIQHYLLQQDSLQNMTQLLNQLGLFYERGLKQTLLQRDVTHQAQATLKEQLLNMMQMPGIPHRLQTKVSTVLHHLNGLQLLAQDQQSIGFLQGYYQLPFAWQPDYSSVHLYYKGKRGKKGEIDPFNCRIWMMITLPFLKDCIVDLQVVNKQLTIQLFNEHDLTYWSNLFELFRQRLQTTAEDEGIILSEFKVHQRQLEEVVQAASWFGEAPILRSGVDIKV